MHNYGSLVIIVSRNHLFCGLLSGLLHFVRNFNEHGLFKSHRELLYSKTVHVNKLLFVSTNSSVSPISPRRNKLKFLFLICDSS